MAHIRLLRGWLGSLDLVLHIPHRLRRTLHVATSENVVVVVMVVVVVVVVVVVFAFLV